MHSKGSMFSYWFVTTVEYQEPYKYIAIFENVEGLLENTYRSLLLQLN